MNTFNKIIWGLASSLLLLSCSDFEDLNNDPTKVGEEKVKSHYLLSKSIVDAQQNPHIAERVFVIEWKSAARFDRTTALTTGANYDAYNADYLSTDYAVGWLNNVNSAINLSEKRLNGENPAPYENNILQMARIWRAYMASELADCFGSVPPVNKYDGVLDYESVEDVYDFILTELAEAVGAMDVNADMSEVKDANTDPFYGGNVSKWIKYANSLRLRYAMRLSEVDPGRAKAEVEAVAKSNNFITSLDDIAEIAEVDGWSGLAGVMSRGWNAQRLSATLNNMMIGLGGIDFRVPEEIQDKVTLRDARKYMGLYLPQHLSTNTNDPAAGFFFDALPSKIDPRATELYHIPGYDDGVVYFSNMGLADVANLMDPETGEEKVNGNLYMQLETKYTWNTWASGLWDRKGDLSTKLIGENQNYPCISKKYRMSTNSRVWFGPWETYFLLAEAALRGWNVPGTDKDNYEAGIAASFEYHGLGLFVNSYLSSTEYNRVGTSVAYDHTTEASSYEVEYVDGYTKEKKTKTYTYPKNSIYRNGEFNNDKLTKIISQKYLAQVPWLPLEAWNDHRRLGLPFFENPAAEVNYNTSNYQIPLTTSNYMECKWEFYQERFKYPAKMEINSKDSYEKAVQLLGGADDIYTPLWWTGRK